MSDTYKFLNGQEVYTKEGADAAIEARAAEAAQAIVHDEVAQQISEKTYTKSEIDSRIADKTTEVVEQEVPGVVQEVMSENYYTKEECDERYISTESPHFTGYPLTPDIGKVYFWRIGTVSYVNADMSSATVPSEATLNTATLLGQMVFYNSVYYTQDAATEKWYVVTGFTPTEITKGSEVTEVGLIATLETRTKIAVNYCIFNVPEYDEQITNKKYVDEKAAEVLDQVAEDYYNNQEADEKFAPIESPHLTGTPTAPTWDDDYFWSIDSAIMNNDLTAATVPSTDTLKTSTILGSVRKYLDVYYWYNADTGNWYEVTGLSETSILVDNDPVASTTIITALQTAYDRQVAYLIYSRQYVAEQIMNRKYVDEKVAAELDDYYTKAAANEKFAPLASPALTGTPTTPDVSSFDSDEKIANKKYVDDVADSTLNTARDELAPKNEPRFTGEAVFSDDVSISGDLFVNGTQHINDSETVQTSDDYMVLRHNRSTVLGNNEHSGVAVHNYAAGKTATMTVDHTGTWRVADNSETNTNYTDLVFFNNTYYEGLTAAAATVVNGIKTAFNIDELYNCVLRTTGDTPKYYHFDGVHWFEVLLDDGKLAIDDTAVSDAGIISELESLTKDDLVYFYTLTITELDAVEDEPLLTRAEETDLQDGDLLQWDEVNKRAIKVPRPASEKLVLKCSALRTYRSGNDSFICYMIDGVLYIGNMESCTVPSDATLDSQSGLPGGYKFAKVADVWYAAAERGTYFTGYALDDTSGIVNATEVTDTSLITDLDTAWDADEFKSCTVCEYHWDEVLAGTDYTWAMPNEVGHIEMTASNTAPYGHIACDGSEVSKATYAALYAAIGDKYGTPVNPDNFVLPTLTDAQNYFLYYIQYLA